MKLYRKQCELGKDNLCLEKIGERRQPRDALQRIPHAERALRLHDEAQVVHAVPAGDRLVRRRLADLRAPHAEHPRGKREELWLEDTRENTAAYRGVQMLIKKIKGEDYQTELIIPKKDVVPIADPVNLDEAVIALVTTGGIVPVDNPDRIQSASATRWGRYDITGVDSLPNRAAEGYKTIHAGFDPAAADADPNVIMPVDAMRAYEKEGKYARLHNYFYSTVGTGTTESEAARMAAEIVPLLQEDGVNAIILTST